MELGAGTRGDGRLRVWREAGEGEQAGGLVEGEARAELAGGSAHHAAAQGRVELAQAVDLEGDGVGFSGHGADRAPPSADWFAREEQLRQDAAELGVPARLVFAGQLGQVGQRLVDGRILCTQHGQDGVANAVAGEGFVGVGEVGAPGLVAGFEEGDEFGAADSEQRTEDFAGVGGAGDEDDWVNAAEALGPCAAEELHQDGLCLVVQGVRGEDGVGAAIGDELTEEVVAQVARGLLDGLWLAGGARVNDAVWNAGAADVQRNFEAQAECLDEREVGVRLVTAQAVVDVDRRQPHAERVAWLRVGGVQQKQQRHRVRASGDGGADAVSGANVGAVQRGPGVCHRDLWYCATPVWGRLATYLRFKSRHSCYTSWAMRVFVILPAAGIGTRMSVGSAVGGGASTPKQFLTIAGVPVLVHCLRAFLAVERVAAVYVAVRGTEMERVRAQVTEFGLGKQVHVVEGGDQRQQSVANALALLVAENICGDDDVVLVHDAARPLIDAATIERTIDAVAEHGAAIVALPAVDTIKQVERTAHGAIVTATIPRERIVQAQTPQGARCGLLRQVFAEAAADEFVGTDESSLLERAGIEVAVVAGSAKNFKITQHGDLELAEFYLRTTAGGPAEGANR